METSQMVVNLVKRVRVLGNMARAKMKANYSSNKKAIKNLEGFV